MNRILAGNLRQPFSKLVISSPSSSSSSPSLRAISTSSSLLSNLDQFRDPISREKRFSEEVGRSWTVKELRRKNFDDLHKLWLVLYKEKNMLLTESELCRRNGAFFPQPERKQKVKKSMAAIKQVLSERKRERMIKFAELREMKQKEEDNDDEIA